jgi:hypothetical protein
MPEKGLLSQTSKKSKDFVVGHLPNKEPTTKEDQLMMTILSSLSIWSQSVSQDMHYE